VRAAVADDRVREGDRAQDRDALGDRAVELVGAGAEWIGERLDGEALVAEDLDRRVDLLADVGVEAVLLDVLGARRCWTLWASIAWPSAPSCASSSRCSGSTKR
jgi:hypothetical protein